MAVQNKDDVDVLPGYEMPEFKIVIWGPVRFERTKILNLGEIVNALGRPGFVATVFFGMELHTATNFDRKTQTGLLVGSFDAAKVSATFVKFIKKFVQCYACGSLETEFLASQKHIAHKCGACAHLSVVDLKERYKISIWERDVSYRLRNIRPKPKQGREGSHKISI